FRMPRLPSRLCKRDHEIAKCWQIEQHFHGEPASLKALPHISQVKFTCFVCHDAPFRGSLEWLAHEIKNSEGCSGYRRDRILQPNYAKFIRELRGITGTGNYGDRNYGNYG